MAFLGAALVDSLIDVAKTAAAVMVPGSKPLIELGEKIVASLDHAKETFGADTPEELDRVRADLDERVNAHVDSTIDKLRGD